MDGRTERHNSSLSVIQLRRGSSGIHEQPGSRVTALNQPALESPRDTIAGRTIHTNCSVWGPLPLGDVGGPDSILPLKKKKKIFPSAF